MADELNTHLHAAIDNVLKTLLVGADPSTLARLAGLTDWTGRWTKHAEKACIHVVHASGSLPQAPSTPAVKEALNDALRWMVDQGLRPAIPASAATTDYLDVEWFGPGGGYVVSKKLVEIDADNRYRCLGTVWPMGSRYPLDTL